MFTVIGCMLAGMIAGCLLSRCRVPGIQGTVSLLFWLLLFLLGWEAGSNRQLIDALPRLGGEALLLSTAATLGSAAAAALLLHYVRRKERKEGHGS